MKRKQSPFLSAPAGLRHTHRFLPEAEEVALIAELEALPFAPFRYRAYRAKRLVVAFDLDVDPVDDRLIPASPLPAFLHPLRLRCAQWLGVDEEALASALVTAFPPGATVRWQREAPLFETMVSVVLASAAVLRLRPTDALAARRPVFMLELPRCAAYVLAGSARWRWEHAMPPTTSLRYVVAFRTLRRRSAGSPGGVEAPEG